MLGGRRAETPSEIARWQAEVVSDRDGLQPLISSQAAYWAECGYPQITTTHRLAASLACTPVDSPELVDTYVVPWPCFVVPLPSGMFARDGAEFVLAIVSCFPDLRLGAARDDLPYVFTLVGGGAEGEYTAQVIYSNTLQRLLGEPPVLVDEAIGGGTIDHAVWRTACLLAAKRIVVGLLILLGDPENRRQVEAVGPQKRHPKKRLNGAPKHRAVHVARPVSVDCRGVLRQYLGGNGPPPSMQTLVRGHWKRQACGPGRAERRTIHVEPYWRGPEDGPIRTRAHVFDL